MNLPRAIQPNEILKGNKVSLRLVTLEDCSLRYEGWLADPQINQYLETRWHPQSLESIQNFVNDMIVSPSDYLFAIIENTSCQHIGNLKVGPINPFHSYADISYFLGEKSTWGRGYATEAICLGTDFGFTRLNLHRIQAGLYAGNMGSAKALEKAGYKREGSLRKQLKNVSGEWEDHYWYAILHEDSKKY